MGLLSSLERIIAASSNEGDVVLDPFCGCGTAVHAAQKHGRRWIGNDMFQGRKPAIHLVDSMSVKRPEREDTGRQEQLI